MTSETLKSSQKTMALLEGTVIALYKAKSIRRHTLLQTRVGQCQLSNK